MSLGVSLCLVAALLGSALAASAQSDRTLAALGPRTLVAVRVTGAPPVIDGRLDDAIWKDAAPARDFVQSNPDPGAMARWQTEARVAYDAHALYVAIRAFDPHPDSIVAPYPRRDDETVSDWVFVEIDSRHDRRTGFSFGLNPRGVQADGAWSNGATYDNTWDGVWQGAARIDSAGWTAEYRIPLSQLPSNPGARGAVVWGINFYRYVGRSAEASDWAPRLPSYADVISHFNTLTGVVVRPLASALAVAPYVALSATRIPNTPGDPLATPNGASPSAGLDFTDRLSPAASLTGTVHPDFGQVEADPSEINLTTFESLFTERRPFFVSDAQLFSFSLGLPFTSRDDAFDSEQPFYSRRVGRAPLGTVPATVRFSDAPPTTTIAAAAKLTGRTESGWAFGVLDAVTEPADARVVDSTGRTTELRLQPLANSMIARAVHEFDDGRSSVGAIATAVVHRGSDSAFDSVAPRDAFVAGFDGRHQFGEAYEVSGFALGSFVRGTARGIASVMHGPGHYLQRPDAGYAHDDTTRTSATGEAAQLRVARVAGAHWRWSAILHALSPRLDVNDLGFQRNADWMIASGSLMYYDYHPGRWHYWGAGFDQLGAGWDFGGERRATVVSASALAELPNYWDITLGARHELAALSTDALRGGPALLLPPREAVSGTITSNARSTSQLTLTASAWWEPATASRSSTIAPQLVVRASDRLRFTIGPSWTQTVYAWQFVDQAFAAPSPLDILARVRQETVSLTGRAIYAFSPSLTLELYAQPFVSAGRYDAFEAVADPRAPRVGDRVVRLTPDQLQYDRQTRRYTVVRGGNQALFDDPSFNAKSLNANAVLRWQFHPGSTLFVVWSQQRSIDGADGSFELSRDASQLFAAPASNTLLIKLSYLMSTN